MGSAPSIQQDYQLYPIVENLSISLTHTSYKQNDMSPSILLSEDVATIGRLTAGAYYLKIGDGYYSNRNGSGKFVDSDLPDDITEAYPSVSSNKYFRYNEIYSVDKNYTVTRDNFSYYYMFPKKVNENGEYILVPQVNNKSLTKVSNTKFTAYLLDSASLYTMTELVDILNSNKRLVAVIDGDLYKVDQSNVVVNSSDIIVSIDSGDGRTFDIQFLFNQNGYVNFIGYTVTYDNAPSSNPSKVSVRFTAVDQVNPDFIDIVPESTPLYSESTGHFDLSKNYSSNFNKVFADLRTEDREAHVEIKFDERMLVFDDVDSMFFITEGRASWQIIIPNLGIYQSFFASTSTADYFSFYNGNNPEHPFTIHIYVGDKPKPDPMFDLKWTKNFVSDSVDNSDAGELKTIIRQKKGTVTGHNVNELLQDLQGCLDNGGGGGGGDQKDTTVTLVKEQSLTYESVDFDGWTGNAAKLEVEDAFWGWFYSMPNVNNIRSNNTPYFPWSSIHVVLNGEDKLYKAAMDYEGETYLWATCRDGDQFAVSKTTDDVYFLPINEPTRSDKVYIYQTKEDIDSYNNGTYLVEIILNEQGENDEGYKHVLVGTMANDVIESLKLGKPVNVAFARVNGGDFSVGYVAYFTTGGLTLVSGFNDDGTFDKKVNITYDPEYPDQKYPDYFVFYDYNIAYFPLTGE